MSSGYRLLVFASLVGLILISFGIGTYSTALDANKERYQPYRYTPEEPPRGEAAATAPTRAKSFEYRTPCHEPKGETESELCAQWRSANAAEDSAFWAKYGFWVAAIGSSLLLWQIILTRQAVEDTDKATKAMQRQNDLMREDMRPWIEVSISVNRIFSSNIHTSVEYTSNFKNIGRSVARNVNIYIDISFAGMDLTKEVVNYFQYYNLSINTGVALLPGESIEISDRKVIENDTFQGWFEVDDAICAHCIILQNVNYAQADGPSFWTFRPKIITIRRGNFADRYFTRQMPNSMKSDTIIVEPLAGQSTR